MGFVVFEKATTPLDWGVKHAPVNKLQACKRHLTSLIDYYQPSHVIMERIPEPGARPRVALLIEELETLAIAYDVQVVYYTHDDVKDAESSLQLYR